MIPFHIYSLNQLRHLAEQTDNELALVILEKSEREGQRDYDSGYTDGREDANNDERTQTEDDILEILDIYLTDWGVSDVEGFISFVRRKLG